MSLDLTWSIKSRSPFIISTRAYQRKSKKLPRESPKEWIPQTHFSKTHFDVIKSMEFNGSCSHDIFEYFPILEYK